MTTSIGRARGLELDAGVDDDAADGVDGVLKQDAGANGLQRELVVGAFDAGQGEQILGKAIHAAGVLENDAEKFERCFRAGIGILDQCFDVALNGSERRAQLVADVGDELAAGFLRGLDAGDVVEHDQRAAEGNGAALTSKTRPGASRLARPTQSSRRSSAPRTQASSSGSRTEWTSGRPGAICAPSNALHDGIGPADKARRGDGDDRFLHGVEHDGQLVAAAFKLGKVPAERDRRFRLSAASIEESSAIPLNGPVVVSRASMRAARSPSAMRRANVTTRRRRAEMRPETQTASGMATASAMRAEPEMLRGRAH